MKTQLLSAETTKIYSLDIHIHTNKAYDVVMEETAEINRSKVNHKVEGIILDTMNPVDLLYYLDSFIA